MKINFHSQVIEMTAKFAKAAAKFGSDEYKQLQEARRDYPDFKVVTATRKSTTKKESYKGLTYKYIEDYIACHANSAERMKEYKEMRLLAECHSVRFPHIKNWFLETYPEVKQFGVRPIKEQETNDVREIKAVELQVA